MTRTPRTRPTAIITAFAAVGLFGTVVWLLYHGQVVLVPLCFAVVVAFVLWTVVDWMGRVPVLRQTPLLLRHAIVLAGFVVAMTMLMVTLRANTEVLVQRLPSYQANVIGLIGRLDERLELGGMLSEFLAGEINLQAVARQGLATAGNLGGLIVLVLLYTTFLLVEYSGFVKKLHLAFPQNDRAEQMIALSADVNRRIGGFLAVKTLVNLMLGSVSYLALVVLGVELAGFWAIFIGVLNYTPYLGSFAGVMFPSLMVLAQSGDLQFTAITVVVLSVLQFVIGAVIEPRIIGRRINLSPLMVLVSLASWYALWGIAGAVLAVPMTVIILAVLGAIPFTRPLAILLSNDGRI